MRNIILLIFIIFVSCDKSENNQLVGSSWGAESRDTITYRASKDGKIRPQGEWADSDIFIDVTFHSQYQISFLTEDKARYTSRHSISNSQISMDNVDLNDFYTYSNKEKRGIFGNLSFSITKDTLYTWSNNYPSEKSKYLNISNIKIE